MNKLEQAISLRQCSPNSRAAIRSLETVRRDLFAQRTGG